MKNDDVENKKINEVKNSKNKFMYKLGFVLLCISLVSLLSYVILKCKPICTTLKYFFDGFFSEIICSYGGFILLVIGFVAVIPIVIKIVKIFTRHDKGNIRPVLIMIILDMIIIKIGYEMFMHFMEFSSNMSVDLYGCPNSKRIAKLNMKRKRVKL